MPPEVEEVAEVKGLTALHRYGPGSDELVEQLATVEALEVCACMHMCGFSRGTGM